MNKDEIRVRLFRKFYDMSDITIGNGVITNIYEEQTNGAWSSFGIENISVNNNFTPIVKEYYPQCVSIGLVSMTNDNGEQQFDLGIVDANRDMKTFTELGVYNNSEIVELLDNLQAMPTKHIDIYRPLCRNVQYVVEYEEGRDNSRKFRKEPLW